MAAAKNSSQSVADRLTAAKHSIAGHGLAKTVCKATTEEVMGPKKKHVDYLVQCTNEPNVSIPTMANLLIERTQHQSWVVVFKGLISIHNVMNYGNERFTQYLASSNCTLNLAGFRDKTGVQGYDMSTFIQRYAKFINEKAYSYRIMAFDFCKVKRGKDDGLLRTMPTEKLLKTLPILQQQVDVLLEFDCTPNELTNGVINACFMLMFKDLIRLFACYNDGIINLLEKYFDMNRKQCKDALDLYKRFIVRMDGVSKMLKTAENVGIDKGDIPDLAKAPSSLLEALEAHLGSLEGTGKKSGGTNSKAPPTTVTSAISTMQGSPNAANLTEEEKQRILDEEKKQMQQLKERKESLSTNPFATSPDGVTSPSRDNVDLFGAGSPGYNQSDFGNLAPTNPFASTTPAQSNGSPWGQQASGPGSTNGLAFPPTNGNAFPPSTGTNAFPPTSSSAFPPSNFGDAAFPPSNSGTAAFPPLSSGTAAFPPLSSGAGGFPPSSSGAGAFPPSSPSGGFVSDSGFASAFGAAPLTPQSPTGGFDGFGEVMRPNNQSTSPQATVASQKATDPKINAGDLDSSLMSLAGNLNINGPNQAIKKQEHQWGPSASSGKQMTGGSGWSSMAPPSGPQFQPAMQQIAPAPMTMSTPSVAMQQPGVAMQMNHMTMQQPIMMQQQQPYMAHTNGWGGMGMVSSQPNMAQPQAGMMAPGFQQGMPMGAQMQGGFPPQQQSQPNLFPAAPAQMATTPVDPNDPFGLL